MHATADDFCSLPQWVGEPEGRSEAEDRAFYRALSQMQVMYAHKKTLCYLLTGHPERWECRPYLERGWYT